MNNIVAGIGDVLLRYPALIEPLTHQDQVHLCVAKEKVVVHLDASAPEKCPPNPAMLISKLRAAGIPYVVVGGSPWCEIPQKLRLHIELVRQARKFIGPLSCFNVVAQLAKVPSFVLVNRSIKEPFVYSLMDQNKAVVSAWNVGVPYERIYDTVVEWARQP